MTEFARKVGVSPGMMHGIKAGNVVPSFTVARRIVESTGGVVTYEDLAAVAPRRNAA